MNEQQQHGPGVEVSNSVPKDTYITDMIHDARDEEGFNETTDDLITMNNEGNGNGNMEVVDEVSLESDHTDMEYNDEDYEEDFNNDEVEEEAEDGWIQSINRVSIFALPCITIFFLYLLSTELGFNFFTMSESQAIEPTYLTENDTVPIKIPINTDPLAPETDDPLTPEDPISLDEDLILPDDPSIPEISVSEPFVDPIPVKPESKKIYGPFKPPKLFYEYPKNWIIKSLTPEHQNSSRSVVIELTPNVPKAVKIHLKGDDKQLMKIVYDKNELNGGIRISHEEQCIYDSRFDYDFEPVLLESDKKVFLVETIKPDVKGSVTFVFLPVKSSEKGSIGHFRIIDTPVQHEDSRTVCRRLGGTLADPGKSHIASLLKDGKSLIHSGINEVWIDRFLGSEIESAFPVIFDFAKRTHIYNPDNLETLNEVDKTFTFFDEPVHNDFWDSEDRNHYDHCDERRRYRYLRTNLPPDYINPEALAARRKALKVAREKAKAGRVDEKAQRSKPRAVLCRFKYAHRRNENFAKNEYELSQIFYEHILSTQNQVQNDNGQVSSVNYEPIRSILKTHPYISYEGMTILHLAIALGDEKLLKLVPDQIYYMHRVDDNGMYALDHIKSSVMGRLLLKRFALELDLFKKDSRSKSGDAFFLAIGMERKHVLNSFINTIPKLIIYTESGYDQPLMRIINFIRTNDVSLRIDPFLRTKLDMTFLQLALTKANTMQKEPIKEFKKTLDDADFSSSKLTAITSRKLKRDAAKERKLLATKMTEVAPAVANPNSKPDTNTIPHLNHHHIFWILSPDARVTNIRSIFSDIGPYLTSKAATKYFYDCFMLWRANFVNSSNYFITLLTFLIHTDLHFLDEESKELKILIAEIGHDFEKHFRMIIEDFIYKREHYMEIDIDDYLRLQKLLAYNPYLKYEGKTIFHLAVQMRNPNMMLTVSDRVPLLHVLDNNLMTCLEYIDVEKEEEPMAELLDRFEIEKAISPFPLEIKSQLYFTDLSCRGRRELYYYAPKHNHEPRVKLEINRDVMAVMKNSYAHSIQFPDIWYPDPKSAFPYPYFTITFTDEMGLDNGGLTDEWIGLLFEHWFRDDTDGTGKIEDFTAPLFKVVNEDSGLYAPNCDYPPEVFKFVGSILALASLRMIGTSVPLIESIYRAIWKIEPTRVEYYEIQSPNTMAAMKTYNREDLDGLEPNQSIDDYIQTYAEGQLYGNYKAAVDAIAEGFAIEKNPGWKDYGFTYFKNVSKGLGHSSYDAEEFRTLHRKFGTGSARYTEEEMAQIVNTFIEVVSEFTDKQRMLLIKFFTSRTSLPYGGLRFVNPGISFHFDYLAKGKFPTAATCSATLHLPKFDTKEELKFGLVYAIENTVDFALC